MNSVSGQPWIVSVGVSEAAMASIFEDGDRTRYQAFPSSGRSFRTALFAKVSWSTGLTPCSRSSRDGCPSPDVSPREPVTPLAYSSVSQLRLTTP